MRKKNVIMAAVLVSLSLAGCGEEGKAGVRGTGSGSPSVEEVLAKGMASAEKSTVYVESPDSVSRDASSASSADDAAGEDVSLLGDSEIQPQEDSSAAASEASSIPDLSDADYIDLTSLSSTMVYSEVYNMMYYPEKYVGKVVKAEGLFSDFYDEEKNKNYFGCIIMDATACCAQGIEFEPLSKYTYPQDFPEDGDTVTVEGTFDIYEEDGYTYCTLRNATFVSG